jgi:membrane protease YdiL (CAAX protease family)
VAAVDAPSRPRGFRPLALLRWLTVEQWRAIDADSRREGFGFDRLVLIVLLTVCVSLTVQEYLGDRDTYRRLFGGSSSDPYGDLKGFAWWAGWRFLGYVVLPMLVIACTPGLRIRDCYLSAAGFWRKLPIYAAMFAAFFPILYLASRTDAFRHTYPFYGHANRSAFDFFAWQALYSLQFLSLEFFFRGFMLEGLRHRLGSNAIFVMIVPYCMIHYGKPWPETTGAILAGMILGTLAMRTRSIWGGVFIHVGVAMSMDALALQGCPPFGSDRPCR